MYLIFAILALSFLIFIHELGHYLMAKRVGMRVETFSIGFGRPIFSWIHKGEKWQIGWLLFGGYVKIAGTDTDDGQDPYAVKDGFFGKSPLDRIKVAFCGPLTNLVFAFLIFCLIFLLGGRSKNFSDYTHKIGSVDPQSELYAAGIRPGDEILSYNNQPYQGSKDHLYGPMTNPHPLMDVKGYKVDPTTGEKTPFDFKIKPYSHPQSLEKGILTSGILAPASYLIYDKQENGGPNPLPEGSPLLNSGIQYGDRIVSVDGERVYSLAEVNQILNEGRALLTVKRGNELKQVRVPRVNVGELKLDKQFKDELIDWQYESGLNGKKIETLYMIPYDISDDATVLGRLKFIDIENQNEAFPDIPFSELTKPLQIGDKIVAIDGLSLLDASDLLRKIQDNRLTIIVSRESEKQNGEKQQKIDWSGADTLFDKEVNASDLKHLTESIGTNTPLKSVDSLYLLNPVVPKKRTDFALSDEARTLLNSQLAEQRKAVQSIEDPSKKLQAQHYLEAREKQLLLGLPNVQDKKVTYNPSPVALFTSVFDEIYRTLIALFTGALNPKWMSGPVGIVQVVHDNWMVGFKEALFWLGAISLNLGALNLLPIPMLDGGTIVISFLELITGKRLHPKTLEKIIIPFAIILIGFFIFLTYNDLSRLFSGFFG